VRIPPVLGVTAAAADVAPATIMVLTASALAAVITTARRRAETLLIDVFPFIGGAKKTPVGVIQSDYVRFVNTDR
jgi:phage-related minor tail protein